MGIDILIPVLGRPQNAEPVVNSIVENTKSPYRIIFICSPRDDEQIKACRYTAQNTWITDWDDLRANYPRKMNWAFEKTTSEWVFLGSDDIEFSPNWDTKALAVAEDKAVIATNDRANSQVKRGQFGTHSLVRREYVLEQGASADGPGVLIHEGYDHNFCDRELCHLAESRWLYAFAKESHVLHRHPLWKTAPMDSTYERGLGGFKKDQLLFFSRAHLWGYVGLAQQERRAAGLKKSRVR